MNETFELFDVETANQVGTYASADDALRVVAEALDRFGSQAVAHLALGREDADGDTEVIARGEELRKLAIATQTTAPITA